MQSTRQAILDYLRMHREATVRDLSRELSLTTTGIRQHLSILEQDGLVAYRDLKGRVGRPALAYRLTDAGEALYPKAYDRLAVALLEAAGEVCPDGLQEKLVVAAAGRLATPLPDASAGSLHARAELAMSGDPIAALIGEGRHRDAVDSLRRASRAKSLAEFLPDALDPLVARLGMSQATLVLDWAEIVGERLAAVCEPARLRWPPRGPKSDPTKAA